MFFKDELKRYCGKIKIYVDMDGVLAYYNLNDPYNFKNKRPLYSNIDKLKEISLMDNIELYILSICNTKNDIIDKNNWLDKYAPFFKQENRVIIPHCMYGNKLSAQLKNDYLLNHVDNGFTTILLDDDNKTIKYIQKNNKKVTLYQDSVLID